jgi:hypothetical protein
MDNHSKPVPEPGQAPRDDGEVHYFEVDETNVSGATESPQPRGDDPPRFERDDEAG